MNSEQVYANVPLCWSVRVPGAKRVLHAVHLQLDVPDVLQPGVHLRAVPRARRHRPMLAQARALEVTACILMSKYF